MKLAFRLKKNHICLPLRSNWGGTQGGEEGEGGRLISRQKKKEGECVEGGREGGREGEDRGSARGTSTELLMRHV